MPSWAAHAPAASTAATWPPRISPPEAISGSRTASRACARRVSTPRPRPWVPSVAGSSPCVLWWPPASTPCRHTPSAPACCAASASSTVVAVTTVRVPASLKTADHGGVRAAEGERHDGHRVRQQQGQLRVVGVVGALVRVAGLGLVPGRLGGEPVAIRLDSGPVRVAGLRDEQVHPERAVRHPAQPPDLLVHRLRRLVAGSEAAEPARLADGGGQLGPRRAAGHGGLYEGVFGQRGQRGGHGPILSRPPARNRPGAPPPAPRTGVAPVRSPAAGRVLRAPRAGCRPEKPASTRGRPGSPAGGGQAACRCCFQRPGGRPGHGTGAPHRRTENAASPHRRAAGPPASHARRRKTFADREDGRRTGAGRLVPPGGERGFAATVSGR